MSTRNSMPTISCKLEKARLNVSWINTKKAAEAAAAETAFMEEMTVRLDSVEHHDLKTQWEDCSHPDWLNIVLQAAQMT